MEGRIKSKFGVHVCSMSVTWCHFEVEERGDDATQNLGNVHDQAMGATFTLH